MRTLLRPLFCAALLASPAAMAGVTGNAGVVSEYLFRGVEQSAGAALQGGVDWAHDSGVYAGTWVSNVAFANTDPAANFVTYETDFYAGYTKKWDLFGFDVGLLQYYYTDDSSYNTLEVYVGALIGPASVKVYYTPDYFGVVDATGDDSVEGMYVTASAALPLTSSITVTPQVGMSSGDGPKNFFGADPNTGNADGEYIDYSVTLTKNLDNGFAFSFAVVGTTLDTTLYPGDDEKLVIGLKKTFEI